jgi:methyl-accepting chemotaxis protein
MPVKKQITGVTNSSVRIGVGIALLVTLIVFGNLFLFVIGPIKRISIVSEKISKGELPEGVKVTKTGDEIETLTQSFRDMALYVAEIETIIEGLSNGMITEGFKAKSAEDVLGNAVERMLAYFKQISVLMIQISHGDVTGSHTPKSEKDVLGVAVAKMNSTLKKFVEEVKEDSDILSTSAEVLKQISDQSQATIAQLAETVGSISQATAESAKNTQIASQSSVQAREMARQGAARMKQLVDKMQLLNDEIVQSTARMEKLSQHSDEIKKMTIVIKAIADETKLLSFNAAIEAARAGEAGRGFVIVAEEIRKLSDMSTEQAVKISSHIKEVRADIASAIEMVVKESDSIRESAALSSETSALFSDIEKSVDDAADRVTDIAASAQQIAASSEESASASEEQAASMQEINAAVGELNDVSKKMKEETDKYRV